MDVLLLGATGRTGRIIANTLVAQGHTVRAMGRRQPENLQVAFTPGDISQAAGLRPVLAGIDAVICALASSNTDGICSRTMAALITAADGRDIRVVTLGGAAVDAPGDAKGTGDRIMGGLMRLVVGPMLADRQRELGLLQASHLRWTMLRPPRLTNAPATGKWQLSHDRPASTAIARADLAQAAVAALGDDTLIRTAPFVAERKI